LATSWRSTLSAHRSKAIIYVLALLLGVRLNWNPAALVGVGVFVVLGASLFFTFSR